MTLHPQVVYLIPAETERVARQAFPTPTPMIAIRDELGMVFSDRAFADLFPAIGQPAESPTRLLLVTIFQYMGFFALPLEKVKQTRTGRTCCALSCSNRSDELRTTY